MSTIKTKIDSDTLNQILGYISTYLPEKPVIKTIKGGVRNLMNDLGNYREFI